MKILTIPLRNQGASLTCYIHDCDGIITKTDLRRAVFVIPGGSYEYCSTREGEPVALAYAARGFNSFLLTYSTSGASWPMPLDDAREAYELVLSHCAEWQTDPCKIAAVGFSAGGHLAAALCMADFAHPAAMVLGYPCLGNPQCSTIPMHPPALLGKATKSAPPCFIFATFEDITVPVTHSLDFARELAALDVPVECHVFQRGAHGLALSENFCADGKAYKIDQAAAQWLQMSVRWLYDLFGEYSQAEQPYVFPTAAQMGYCVDIVTEDMASSPECMEILQKFFPSISDPAHFWGARKFPIRVFNANLHSSHKLNATQIEELDRLLKKVSEKR